ncbi:MAG: hypothetical protein HY695_38770 [Deltaproteobacteria bacterium]|nr:hypothetical protein [Deltaproteobacteria bacterium]
MQISIPFPRQYENPPRPNPFACWKQLSWFLLLICLSDSPAFPWGPEGHEYINQVAALKAPAGLNGFPLFFQSQESIRIIAYNGPEPDRWKAVSGYSRGRGHSVSHYINLDMIQEIPKRQDHILALRMYQDRGLDGQVAGLLPYYIFETYEKLRMSFAEYRKFVKRGSSTRAVEANILYYAGLLGHYVGDGSQPLHTSAHHHGWVGENPKGHAMDEGIHRRFEVDFVRKIKAESFAGMVRSPSRICDPFAEITKYLKKSYSYVEKIYELDKAEAFTKPTPESLGFVKERLAAASQMLVKLWYTAWLESEMVDKKDGVCETEKIIEVEK